MSTTATEAWVLYEGKASGLERAELVRETFEFPSITADEVLVEALYGCWEGNMGHALDRKPVDICRLRGEKKIVIGNAGVVRVLECGANVKNLQYGADLRPGVTGILFPGGTRDPYGYTKQITGYDAPGTMGVLAKRLKLRPHEILPIAPDSNHSLAQWAAWPVRYATAWSNFELAYGTLRLQLKQDELPHPHVWSWGGGTALAELDLARRFGCKVVMMSGDDGRLAEIERYGVTSLDRRKFGDLTYDEQRFAATPTLRRDYMKAEAAFLKTVQERTEGLGVNIFVDYIGAPVLRPTLKALARHGIIATAGWKEGQIISFLRAAECIDRHQYIHTHFARYSQGVEAMRYSEKEGWIPRIEGRIYSFDEIPRLAADFNAGNHGLFPVFSVNPQ